MPHDLHLKGSGATPFSRGGDGRAALGPMLREYVISEAMHALGIPTHAGARRRRHRRAASRGTVDLPGAVLARVAASHLRVGSFQYAGATGDVELLRRLADHAIARHHPDAAAAEQPYVALFEAVAEAQAALVARWMLVGFVHGVMNTDNTTISGETIDYGPCAFMDTYDPATVFSSIDHGGRYAYGNQPRIVHWNLARLAEALLPLFADELEPAVAVANGVLQTFAGRYEAHWLARHAGQARPGRRGRRRRHAGRRPARVLRAQGVDFTSAMRSLSSAVAGDPGPSRALFSRSRARSTSGRRGGHERRAADARAAADVAAAMDRVNPIYIPRNHLVEAALDGRHRRRPGPVRRAARRRHAPVRRAPGLDAYAARRRRRRSPRHVLRHLTSVTATTSIGGRPVPRTVAAPEGGRRGSGSRRRAHRRDVSADRRRLRRRPDAIGDAPVRGRDAGPVGGRGPPPPSSSPPGVTRSRHQPAEREVVEPSGSWTQTVSRASRR